MQLIESRSLQKKDVSNELSHPIKEYHNMFDKHDDSDDDNSDGSYYNNNSNTDEVNDIMQTP